MKHFKTVFNVILSFVVMIPAMMLLFVTPDSDNTDGAASPGQSATAGVQHATTDDSLLTAMDSVEVSLLTCQPHDEVYSLYGHTALRWHDMRRNGADLVFNYGVFNFNAPHFVARFVFGLTDYELGVCPFPLFAREYVHYGSMVSEQVLNLKAQEKIALRDALALNLQPENVRYRYNYFYNNCTTMARDIVERCMQDSVCYRQTDQHHVSWRTMVHEMTASHRWTQFGIDLLLGVMADGPTTTRQRQFLPHRLMADADSAVVMRNGTPEPLVSAARIAVNGGVQTVSEPLVPLTPSQCAWIITALSLALAAWQWHRRRTFIAADVLPMAACGTIGIVLTLMLFSQHPTVQSNFQFALLNPVHLLFIRDVVRRKRPANYWTLLVPAMVFMFTFSAVMQSYAEGIWCLDVWMLLQCLLHMSKHCKQAEEDM